MQVYFYSIIQNPYLTSGVWVQCKKKEGKVPFMPFRSTAYSKKGILCCILIFFFVFPILKGWGVLGAVAPYQGESSSLNRNTPTHPFTKPIHTLVNTWSLLLTAVTLHYPSLIHSYDYTYIPFHCTFISSFPLCKHQPAF